MRLMSDLGAGHGNINAFASDMTSRDLNEWIAEYSIRSEDAEQQALEAKALAKQAAQGHGRRRRR